MRRIISIIVILSCHCYCYAGMVDSGGGGSYSGVTSDGLSGLNIPGSIDVGGSVTIDGSELTSTIAGYLVGTTSFAATFLDDANEAAVKATLNLEPGTDVQAYSTTLYNIAQNSGAVDISGTTFTQPPWGSGGTVFEGATVDDYETSLTATDPTADNTIALPDASGTVSLIANTETLTNKTIDADDNTFSDIPCAICVAASDETTDLTTGTAKVTFRLPYAMTLTAVRTSVNTAPVGSTLTVDVNEDGTTVLSTVVSIDASEETSETAATEEVISDSSLADDAEMTIDIDQIGSSTAGKGLKVCLIGTRDF